MAQNKQFPLKLLTFRYFKFLKFCYFLSLLLFISCDKASTSKKTKKATSPIEETEVNATQNNTPKQTILCFGDSITAGYGLDDTTDAYPGVLQEKIDAAGLAYTVINSGVSGETSAGGKSRIDWVIREKPAVFILELGANDGLRGVPISETKANLQAIISSVKEKSPNTKIILAGMQLPPNMGQDYTTAFKQVFYELAEENTLEFIPFILKDVGGITALNQNDGIHPNVKGHQILANTVWEVLGPLVKD